MSIGERLKEERLRLNLSQEAFGELGGVAKVAQFNYEKDKRKPDAEYLKKLFRHGIDIVYVLTGKRDEFSKDELELIELFRKASLKKKICFLKILADDDIA